jgi:hypothetical protein
MLMTPNRDARPGADSVPSRDKTVHRKFQRPAETIAALDPLRIIRCARIAEAAPPANFHLKFTGSGAYGKSWKREAADERDA